VPVMADDAMLDARDLLALDAVEVAVGGDGLDTAALEAVPG
jgi:hypothetical protein